MNTALNFSQLTAAIATLGHEITYIVEGDMGSGKTSMLKTLDEMLPNHHPCYFDGTTKDIGDMMIPNIRSLETGDYVSFVPNEEYGVHLGQPIILMIDEIGKMMRPVFNANLAVMQERKVGNTPLPEGSIVFGTTNLGAENVGDLLPPHGRNRCTIVRAAKPTAMEWVEWGINNGIDHSLLGWVKETPQLMQSFDEVENPEDNPYIYHPRAQRAAFVTGRSLEKASHILKKRGVLDNLTVRLSLEGTIGARATADLMAFVSLADKLPTLEDIKNNPENAPVPDMASAITMIVFRTLAVIEADWVDAWMTYLNRLDKEAQGMFGNSVIEKSYKKQKLFTSNKHFRQWALENNYMFGADQ